MGAYLLADATWIQRLDLYVYLMDQAWYLAAILASCSFVRRGFRLVGEDAMMYTLVISFSPCPSAMTGYLCRMEARSLPTRYLLGRGSNVD